MKFIRISEKYNIYKLLTEFSEVFPHLTEKISNLEDYAEKLSVFAYVYAANDNSENVGILVFYANDIESKEAYISLIGVKKGKECKGIGKALLDYCSKLSREHGMCKIRLEVDKDNSNAIKFYEKNGFSFLNATARNSFYMEKNI